MRNPWLNLGLTLFSLGLLSSMAAMEMISWALWLFALILSIHKRETFFHPKKWINAAISILLVSVIIGVGLWSPPHGQALQAIGWCRWILLLCSWTYLLSRFLKLEWEQWHWRWAAVAGLMALYAIGQFFFGWEITRSRQILIPFGPFWRATGMFNLSLTFAYVIGMAGFFIFGLALTSIEQGKKARSAFALSMFGLCSFAIFATLTRGAWIAWAAAIMLIIGLYRPRRLWIVALAIGVLLGGVLLSSSDLSGRLTSIFDPTYENNRQRLVFWASYWQMFLDYPLFGVGLGHAQELLPEYIARVGGKDIGFYSHAHNNVLHFLGSIGLIGTTSFVALSGYFLWLSYKLGFRKPNLLVWYRSVALGILGAQIYMHVGGLTEANFFDGEVNHMLVFMWALLSAIESKKENFRIT